MTDLVSRQTVLDALDNLCNVVCQYSKKQRSVMCGACPLGGAFDTIEGLPSAETEKTGEPRCRFCGGKLSEQRTDGDGRVYRHCYGCHFDIYEMGDESCLNGTPITNRGTTER